MRETETSAVKGTHTLLGQQRESRWPVMPTAGLMLGQSIFEAILDNSPERWRRAAVQAELHRLFAPPLMAGSLDTATPLLKKMAEQPGYRLRDWEVLTLSAAAQLLFEDHAARSRLEDANRGGVEGANPEAAPPSFLEPL
ncbi:hypothetical protein [Parvularcula maris]|uniref:Uncharacterized protein n=1 Tax=Parvularcula maris TaxID=2965077 RepID=A0A9X2LCM9_9PROT|nr:hypothetical protein [Parvularcula maris]MCQ8186052.1 hypothetical protein [Parvularcula maris]